MNQDRHKRKMSVIFSADVVGYSRMMEADEAWTIKSLEENKSLISNLIENYDGRVVDAPGDNILAEFRSVTNAVECAVRIQQELKAKNSRLKEEHQMEFRIGINLGEIVEEGGRIYGSGVNIAARIEGLSESGGICISGRTYDHIKSKFDFGYEFLGEHKVKNISEPIRVYRVLMEPESAGKVIGERKVPSKKFQQIVLMAIISFIVLGFIGWYFYSNKIIEKETPKTIAVLPFDDLSSGKDQEHFVLGLSEEILNSLCQIPDLGVSGKTSSFSFKGTKKTIQQIASELGVNHILEGSVRKAGEALRITAQLVRASDGLHLWSDTYDRELNVKAMFIVQEDIAAAVAEELKLTLGIDTPLKQLGGTDNIDAYEFYLIAKGQINNWTYSPALESITTAVSLDPGFARAWALKGRIHWLGAVSLPANLVASEIDAGLSAAMMAVKIEPKLAEAYLSLGLSKLRGGDFIEAELAYRKGIELGTGIKNRNAEYGLGLHYLVVGHLKRAVDIFEESRRDDPLNLATRYGFATALAIFGDIKRYEVEVERCRELFGDTDANNDIFAKYIGTMNAISPDTLVSSNSIYAAAIKHLDSPEEGLVELSRFYTDNVNLSSANLNNIAMLAGYFGDAEFAMKTIEKSSSLDFSGLFHIWYPVFYEVRQLTRFKEFASEIGLVDYWKEYGWPDLCRPIGDDDFECD